LYIDVKKSVWVQEDDEPDEETGEYKWVREDDGEEEEDPRVYIGKVRPQPFLLETFLTFRRVCRSQSCLNLTFASWTDWQRRMS
jgi:hypothetical protein